ncbi:transposase [Anoxybacillus tepidamans]|uniref:Transposase n=1 Tax=Anoxybacteroides tepidamans TaxID=265948 RepID=A0A7W8IS67_9BACL|nr:winged helix-turn-helix domain-containing protein [Anoxybacillus tepidamans]MBB5325716.1 transposase [Anoxybacillus tepidamans]
MKRLKITNDHGFIIRKLQKEERKIKEALLHQRVTAVRLIMEGYLGEEIVSMLNIHRQSMLTYVSLFNDGGFEKLLDKKVPQESTTWKTPFLTAEQQMKLKQMIVTSTPFDERFGMAASWDTRIVRAYLQEHYVISMTRMGVYKMLRRIGLSYTRPTYILAKGNEQQ